ncbi:MAG TPA: hypothetical protein VLJ62_06620 [Burkholderiaceae bacterium]|nr:hypothetical protein [Burkholderiaceae bacterium]
MDAAVTRCPDAQASQERERLLALGNFICSSDGPLAAAMGLRRDLNGQAYESVVSGGSMGASIPNGVRIRVAEGGQPKRDQIIAFVSGGKTFVHRIRWCGHTGAARDWIITQGDAMRLPDLPVHANAVLGHVIAVEHGATWQAPTARQRLPRRDRALSLLLLVVCATLLEIHPRLAHSLIDRLRNAEARRSWTGALLYGDASPPRQRTSLVYGMAIAACRLGALTLRAIRGWNVLLLSLWDSGQRLLGAVCSEALSLEEKGRLTIRIYDFFPGYHRTFDRLHEWEGPWFAGSLPAAPARVLIGGAGVGREAVALAARGLSVDAFDPAPDLVAACRRALREGAWVDVLTYEAFSALVLGGPANTDAARHLRSQRYDAILLGSGSLAHVLDANEHSGLLRACAALCPAGPVLMSFYCDDDGVAPRAGLATRTGRRIGRMLAALRGLKGAASDRLSYRPHGGFAYTFTRQEVEALAASIGRGVRWEPATAGVFRCVTLLPPTNPAPPL